MEEMWSARYRVEGLRDSILSLSAQNGATV